MSLRQHLTSLDAELGTKADIVWATSSPIHDRQTAPDASDGGRLHCKRVEENAAAYLSGCSKLADLSPLEVYLLSVAACTHDYDKGLRSVFGEELPEHGVGSGEYVASRAQVLSLSNAEADAVERVISIHALIGEDLKQHLQALPREYPISSVNCNLQRLAICLKVADVLHTDSSRISNLAVDVTHLDALDRMKHIARGAISGWRVDGSRVILTAVPGSDEELRAVTDCFSFLKENEWLPMSGMLASYGFARDLELAVLETSNRTRRRANAGDARNLADTAQADDEAASIGEPANGSELPNPLAELRRAIQASTDRRAFRIRVLGPALPAKMPKRRPYRTSPVEKHATFLRFEAVNALLEIGFDVSLDDTPENLSQCLAGESTEPDAAIVFPCSAGSLCEFALIAAKSHLAQRTLVIIDDKFRDDRGFVKQGVVELMRQSDGRVEFIPYAEHKKIIELACAFAEEQHRRPDSVEPDPSEVVPRTTGLRNGNMGGGQ